ncbi:hypothetical protein [Oryza sativa Japonica Group]|uniref:Uncharacterized protein n=1 Tax=Oryza sativa subsp. japonica TaxID=39947 RepID=Q5NAD8_ORYSJ|nr:hypothetical protein [Oryza sativa Japonica Group]
MRRPAAGWPWPGALVDLVGGAVAGPGVVGAAAGAGVAGVVGAAAGIFLEETGDVVVGAATGVGGDGGFGREEVAGDGEVNGGAGCMFNVVPGLDGKPGSVSLELGSKPGCFLVAGASTKVQLSILEETGDGEVNGGGGGMGTDAQLISAGRRSQGHSRRSRSTVAREERGERVEEREMGRE